MTGSRRWTRATALRTAAAAVALLVLTNGPVLLFSKSVLNRTGRWEDLAVWPFLAAAAVCGGALALRDCLGARGRRLEASERIAAASVGSFALAALASSLWSVDAADTAWRSSVYVGMALLAWALSRLDPRDIAMVAVLVAGAAVSASLLLIALRPDLGLGPADRWKGVYTNPNSLAPLAAIGVLAGASLAMAGTRLKRIAGASLAAASTAALIGAGSRTAWVALAVAVAASALPPSHHWLGERWGPRRAAAASLAGTLALAAGASAALAALWDFPTLSQRRAIWRLVWDRILQRPLGGYGFFTFWDVEELTDHVLLRRGSAHNSLVEVGLGLGLLGAVPFVAVLVLAAHNAGLSLWRRPGPDTWMWGALVAFLLVTNVMESFVLWFSYSWVLLMAAALKPVPGPAPAGAWTAGGSAPPGTGPSPPSRLQRALPTLRPRLAAGGAEPTGTRGAGRIGGMARLRSGWLAVALMSAVVLAAWLPDLDLPLGNSDDGRIVAFSGLHARNFWDLGPIESAWGARVDPFVRPEFNVEPRSDPPVAAVTYAHHPPLKDWISTASTGLLGDTLAALRLPAFLMGAATVAFMASLLRACRLSWGPVLAACAAMASTGFFYVYARLGVGFSLLVAAAAAAAWLRRIPRPQPWALAATAAVAALAAMQSWIAMASLAPLAAWLSAGRRRAERPTGAAPGRGCRSLTSDWTPALAVFVLGAATGAAVTAVWMLNATGIAELVDRFAFRSGNRVTSGGQALSFGFGEFLSRQWKFATEELMVPPWLRVLLVPALLAGLIDRRTRVPTAITLAAAAALTFGLQQGAWIHRLWNFPWLAPVTIGLAALFDAVRRAMPARARTAAGLAVAAVAAATLVAVAAGGTRDRFISEPARLGEALEQAAATGEAHRATAVWTGPGLPTPRWASYYFDMPVWNLEESRLPDLDDSDLVILRESRTPDFIAEEILEDALASAGDFRVVTAGSLPK